MNRPSKLFFLFSVVIDNSVLIILFIYLFFHRLSSFGTIYLYWQNYQSKMLAKLKPLQSGITIAGDGRHDSMGHTLAPRAW